MRYSNSDYCTDQSRPQANFFLIYGWLFIIYGCFSAKSGNTEEEILQLKIPAIAKFNVKPIYCLFSVTQLITVTFKKSLPVAIVMKKRSETQTLRAGRSNVQPKIFTPPQTPFPGAQDGQNLIRWRWSLPSPTDPVWWKSMHTISSYRG